MSLFEIEGLDELVSAMDMVSQVYPKEVKKFMQKEGNKLRNRTVKTAKSSVGRKTGNFLKGIKRGKYYKYKGNGTDSIRVYAGSPAHHGHLLEYGHEMVSHNGESTGKHVQGYYIFKTSANMFERTYENDCDTFADKIVEQLNKGG